MIDLFLGLGLETKFGLTATYCSAIFAFGNFFIMLSMAVVLLLTAAFETVKVSSGLRVDLTRFYLVVKETLPSN